MDTYPPHSDIPATLDDIERIKQAATERARYLCWLADKLELSSDYHLRKTISGILRQLAGQ